MLSNLGGPAWQAAKEPLRRYLTGDTVTEVAPPKSTECFCLWELYDLSAAQEVPCASLSRFMLLLGSKGTHSVKAACLSTPGGFVDLTLYGPLCDDAIHATTEREGRLRASYRLFAKVIHEKAVGLSQEEKRLLVETVGKKGKVNMQLFCKSLNLARSSAA